jgi:hypothetical protein
MNEYIVKATDLLKMALINNNATLDASINECIFYYVPKMLCHHREYWNEEHLLIFCTNQQDEFIDYLDADPNQKYCHSRVYIYSIKHNDVDTYLKQIVAWHIQLDLADIDDKIDTIMPAHYKIDPREFINIPGVH